MHRAVTDIATVAFCFIKSMQDQGFTGVNYNGNPDSRKYESKSNDIFNPTPMHSFSIAFLSQPNQDGSKQEAAYSVTTLRSF